MQQHSLMALFCEECGLANDPEAICCTACQHPFSETARDFVPSTQATNVSSSLSTSQAIVAGEIPASYQHSALIDFPPGTLLADCYRIEEEIGRGGFSIVYRAVEVDDQRRQVAIKRIPLSTLTPSQVIDATETFNREISMLKRFSGAPGVPRYHGYLVDQENWYLIMEYIAGETVEEALQKAPGGYFSESQTIALGLKLTHILQVLHTDQPPVIFRDVKPANIMLTSDHQLFLIDFGIARHFTFGKSKDTTPLGSPGYAPPEQYGRAQTDRRADIYGLGATLQTLVTGRDPQELAAGEAPRNQVQLSSAFRELLEEMLSSEPAKRPVDMIHVRTRLEQCLPENKPLLTIYYSFWQSFFLGSIVGAMLRLVYVFGELTTTWLFLFAIGMLGMLFGILLVSVKRFTKKQRADRQGKVQVLSSGWMIGAIVVVGIWQLVLWLWPLFGWRWPF